MTTRQAAVLTSYIPGRWLALSGPTAVVMIDPGPHPAATLVAALWNIVSGDATLDDIADEVDAWGLERAVVLAVPTPSDGHLQGLTLGEAQVVDADSDVLLLAGDPGAWTTSTLMARRVRVTLNAAGPTGGFVLPLVLGVVPASGVLLELLSEMAVASNAGAGDQAVEPEVEPPPSPVVDRSPQPVHEPTQMLGERPPYAPGQEPDRVPAPPVLLNPPLGQGASGTTGPWGAQGFGGGLDAVLATEQIDAEAAPGQREIPEVLEVPEVLEISEVLEGPEPQPEQPPVEVDVVCPDGSRTRLTGAILVGRAPRTSPDFPDADLLRVLSPNRDISRTHVAISMHDGSIEVIDLNSTNGTIVALPDGQQVMLEPGQPIQVTLGARIDLGDDQVLTLDAAD